MTGFDVVVAAELDGGIGQAGELPWKLPTDLAHFKRVTREAPAGQENAVIMGRATWETIPPRFRPLAGRRNLVLSRQVGYRAEGAVVVDSLDRALAAAAERPGLGRAFVVGGGEIYAQAVARPDCGAVWLTRVLAHFPCDTFFPALEPLGFVRREVVQEGDDGGLGFRIEVWERP